MKYMEGNSRACESSSWSGLGHLVIMLIRRCVRQILLRWWGRWFGLRAWGVSIRIVRILSGSTVLIVSPLFVGLVRLLVVVSTVAAILIVRCIIVRVVVWGVRGATIPLVEFVTVQFPLLWGVCVRIFVERISAL